jgi:DNA-binding transcriptional MerR regulator/DNA gyrase inhibitor GyrI
MSQYVSIHDITLQLGLTSRTLRHWEQKGLFKSSRDPQSDWRVYDDEAIKHIRLILLLRELDIPIKDVKKVIDSKELFIAAKVFEMQIHKLEQENMESLRRMDLLKRCLSAINALQAIQTDCSWIECIENTLAIQIFSKQTLKSEWEEIVMKNNMILSDSLRFITLPVMRVAVCNVISESPEDEAIGKVLGWAEKENLMGTARTFGFNTTPYSPECKKYGWAACISVPGQVKIPDFLEEKYLPGGLYAALNSTNEVYDSWQTLMRLLKESEEYKTDESRPCLEELIRSGEPIGQGNDFYLTLLEPVQKK